MQSVLYKNTPIHYTDRPGKINVVLLHGFLEDKSMWESFTRNFPSKYRLVAIDLLGHGATGSLGYVHSMEEQAAAVYAVLKHLRIKRFNVIGHSMGGYVALALAEDFPDAIKSLTLFHSSARADTAVKKADRDRAIAAVKTNPTLFIKTAIPNLFAPHLRETLQPAIQVVITKALSMQVRGIVAALEGMKTRVDREVLLHFGPCPILFIAGKLDPVLPFSSLAEQMEGNKIIAKLITDNGHMGFLEDTDICATVILEFLKKHG